MTHLIFSSGSHARWRISLLAALAAFLIFSAARAEEAAPAPVDEVNTFFQQTLKPFLANHCVRCHGDKKAKGDMKLEGFDDLAAARGQRQTWLGVVEMLSVEAMPPADEPQPDAGQRAAIAEWVGNNLTTLDCSGPRDPGRVTIRRLNRTEYNNTIRDLVGVDFHPAEGFPADDITNGFDNIADALTMPPVLIEKYLTAAEQIAERAIPLLAAAERPETARQLLGDANGQNWRDTVPARLEAFVSRAFRRPATTAEVERYVNIVDTVLKAGDSFEQGMQLALQGILISPHFLFRVELDETAAPGDAAAEKPSAEPPIRLVGEYELASRLSYFLWTSMPDEELFHLAKERQLRAQLDAQVARMVRHPKAQGLVNDFAGQWLQLRGLPQLSPSSEQFPEFDEALREAMRRESELFFEHVMREDRSILDFLDANYTFLNERLARHYGIAGVAGEAFRRVELSDRRRGGILTQASVLTLTSNPTRTSPVKRGKWVLEQILGTPPPPAPANVPPLNEDSAVQLTGTVRQRFEQHRSKASCAACHESMDPLGFGLENFDAVGAWRDREGEFAVDSSGILPDGSKFNGPVELRAILLNRRDEFCRGLIGKLLTYSLGRALADSDECVVRDIAQRAAEQDYRFSALVHGIVHSVPFQYRRSGDDK